MNQTFIAVIDTTVPGIDLGLGPLRPMRARSGMQKTRCTFLNGLTFPGHYTYLTQAGHAIL